MRRHNIKQMSIITNEMEIVADVKCRSRMMSVFYQNNFWNITWVDVDFTANLSVYPCSIRISKQQTSIYYYSANSKFLTHNVTRYRSQWSLLHHVNSSRCSIPHKLRVLYTRFRCKKKIEDERCIYNTHLVRGWSRKQSCWISCVIYIYTLQKAEHRYASVYSAYYAINRNNRDSSQLQYLYTTRWIKSYIYL